MPLLSALVSGRSARAAEKASDDEMVEAALEVRAATCVPFFIGICVTVCACVFAIVCVYVCACVCMCV